MKYYVVSDVHGFYDELIKSLEDKGFFTDTEARKLIVCGDLFDRGKKAKEMQAFIMDLLAKDEVILIKGNHEDLALDLLKDWNRYSYMSSHHHTNGTLDTVFQLTETSMFDISLDPYYVKREFLKTAYIQDIIPKMLDYYETEHYIFVHGWIPSIKLYGEGGKDYAYLEGWRDADDGMWNDARWINGMKASHDAVIEKGKAIVCGHWHTSFGHAHYEKRGQEFGEDADFTPYYAEGIIAIDACTAYTKMVNCLVIED